MCLIQRSPSDILRTATGNSIKVPPHKKTNARGWKVSMFDPELFRTALATGPMNANNAIEEAEEIMERVVDACDATMPRKSTRNRHPPVYWWNDNIAALRKECIKARMTKTSVRKEGRNYKELNEKYKRMQLELFKSIKASKRQCWNELLEEVEGMYWDPTSWL